ncbi:hypothetical protein [Aliivibrio fischeri]|uniref:hypothetical protein n=1 Tax=Aliivibrio fischeri TaxID=668 RepID=UPI0007C5AFED|nr:hypothetical protein [Aliivibrio fischeri]
MKLIRTTTFILAALFSISGCGWNGYKQHELESNKVKDSLDKHLEFIYLDQSASYIDEPPQFISAMDIDTRPAWLTKKHINIKMKGKQPMQLIMGGIAKQAGLFPIYSSSIDTSKRIDFDVNNASLIDTLDYLQALTDYSYRLDGKQVYWSKYTTKTIPIATLIGNIEFGMGTESGSGSESDSSTSDSTTVSSSDTLGGSSSDYTMISDEELEVITGIRKGVESILGDVGTVSVNKATTNLTVTTSPSKMRLVELFVKNENREMTKQAVLTVQILNFQSNISNSAGVDWNLVKTFTNGSLNFVSGNVASASNGFMRFNPTGNGLDGSSLLISALEEQGIVSVSNSVPVTVMNNRPTRFAAKDKTAYISNVKVINDSELSQSTTELEKGLVEEGYSLYTLAKIIDDKVLLQLSSELSALKDFDKQTVNDVEVKTPLFTESAFNQPNIVNNGQTLVVNAFRQHTSSSGKNSQFNNELMGGNNGSTKTIETLVLITPIIL